MFVTSGYRPIQPIYAIRSDAAGDISLKPGETSNSGIAWSMPRGGPYLPTPIVVGDRWNVCLNNGVIAAYLARSGECVYQQRVASGAAFSASPVASHGVIYLTSEDGEEVVRSPGRSRI